MADNQNKTIAVSLSIWQLEILLEATNYFLDGLEDDEETDFVSDKYDVAEISKLLERLVANDR